MGRGGWKSGGKKTGGCRTEREAQRGCRKTERERTGNEEYKQKKEKAEKLKKIRNFRPSKSSSKSCLFEGVTAIFLTALRLSGKFGFRQKKTRFFDF